MARALMAVFGTALLLAYPLGVWWGLRRVEPRTLALMGLGALTVAALARVQNRAALATTVRTMGPAAVALGLAAVFGDAMGLLFVPVVTNVILLAAFATTLRPGVPPMIERFARMTDPELPVGGVAYCRRVTWVWCAFFALNGLTAGLLALFASTDAWALYTGGLAYGLMGLLFAGEYLVRKAKFRRYGHRFHDRLLARVWPPRSGSEVRSP